MHSSKPPNNPNNESGSDKPKLTHENMLQCLKSGNVEGVKACINSDLSINFRDRIRRGESDIYTEDSPLTYILNPEFQFSPEIRYEMTKLLLENNADPNLPNYRGETPLVLAYKLHDEKIIDILKKNGADPATLNLILEIERGVAEAANTLSEAGDRKTERERAIVTPTGTELSDPLTLAKLHLIISNAVKIMKSNSLAYQNIFTNKKRAVKNFGHIKVRIPEYLNVPFEGQRIKGIKIIAGHATSESKYVFDRGEDSFAKSLGYIINDFDPATHKNIVIQLTLDSGQKTFVTVQTKQDADVLNYMLNEHMFQEEAHIHHEPALLEDDWNELSTYDEEGGETENFYRKKLHPKMLADIEAAIAKEQGAVVMEIGAGLGKLAMDVYQKISASDKEIHVVGTELYPQNVATANKEANNLPKTGKNSIGFFKCDSLSIVDDLKAEIDRIKQIQQDYFARFNRTMPFVIAASGALNRLVLNSTFESLRVMQNIYRLNPDMMIVSGITETLLNQHMLKNLGFATLFRDQGGDISSGSYYKLKPKSIEALVKYYEEKLTKNPSLLDLSLNAAPLSVFSKMDPKSLSTVKSIDISHAFFLNENEMQDFFAAVQQNCPNLEQIVFGYHFSADKTRINAAIKELSSGTLDEQRFASKIKAKYTKGEESIAFSPKMIARMGSPEFYFKEKRSPKESLDSSPADKGELGLIYSYQPGKQELGQQEPKDQTRGDTKQNLEFQYLSDHHISQFIKVITDLPSNTPYSALLNTIVSHFDPILPEGLQMRIKGAESEYIRNLEKSVLAGLIPVSGSEKNYMLNVLSESKLQKNFTENFVKELISQLQMSQKFKKI